MDQSSFNLNKKSTKLPPATKLLAAGNNGQVLFYQGYFYIEFLGVIMATLTCKSLF